MEQMAHIGIVSPIAVKWAAVWGIVVPRPTAGRDIIVILPLGVRSCKSVFPMAIQLFKLLNLLTYVNMGVVFTPPSQTMRRCVQLSTSGRKK
jgi:hypothetical protein